MHTTTPSSMLEATLVLFMRQPPTGPEVLLGHKRQGVGQGKWVGVGGKRQAGESLRACAIREANEELRVRPNALTHRATLDFIWQGGAPDGQSDSWRVYVFACNSWEENPQPSAEVQPKWFSYTRLPWADMWPDALYWLPHVLRGKLVHGHFVYRGEQLDDYTLTLGTPLEENEDDPPIPDTQNLILDRFERTEAGEVGVIELEAGGTAHIPQTWLPPHAQASDVITCTQLQLGKEQHLRLIRDPKAREERLAALQKLRQTGGK